MSARGFLLHESWVNTLDYPVWSNHGDRSLFREDPLLVDDVGFGHPHQLITFIGLAPGINQYRECEIQPLTNGGISFFVVTRSMLTARITNPSFSKVLYKTSIEGISSRQGLHQVAQKFRNTTLPR